MTIRQVTAYGFVAVGLAALLLLEVYSGTRPTPTTMTELALDAHARHLVDRACRDCHADRSEWTWYVLSAGAADRVRANEMPPAHYVATHPATRLTTDEREVLARGLDRLRDADDRGEERWGSPSGWITE